MLPRWTISIRDFGRIKSAEITLAPLTVLVGRNNTGKSYVASLLWGLLNPEGLLFPREIPTDEVYKACDEAIAEAVLTAKAEKKKVFLSAELFVAWVETLVRQRSGVFLSTLFSYPGLDAKELSVLNIKLPKRNIVIDFEEIGFFNSVPFLDDVLFYAFCGRLETPYHRRDAINAIANAILTGVTWSGSSINSSTYIPAGRSGLALTLPAVIDKALGKAFGVEVAEGPIFPLPLLGFLRLMASQMKVMNVRGEPVARFIEKEIMGGRFARTKPDSVLFQFQPDGGGAAIPLHAASSLVSELGPLAEVLSGTGFNTIIIEEPEAHLHLEAQMSMARACARLVSSGVRVVITTHSDTFLQYLNNLMMLHDHPRKDEFMRRWNLSEEDVIDPANALGYEFECPDGSTVVKEMTKGAAGFEPATMNSLLRDLTIMTRDLLADQDDEE